MTRLIIACDPGVEGATVLYIPKTNTWVQGRNDPDKLVDLVGQYACRDYDVHLVVEQQSSRPGQAYTSFVLGTNFGDMRSALKMLFRYDIVKYQEVAAITWQKGLGFKPLNSIKDAKARYDANKDRIHHWVQGQLNTKVFKYAADAYAIALWANQ